MIVGPVPALVSLRSSLVCVWSRKTRWNDQKYLEWNGIVYRQFMYWRKYQTMKIAKSLMMDLSRQYSSKAKVRMMHRFYSGCLLYLVNLHAFTLLRRFSVTIVLRGYLLIFRNCWFQIKVYLSAYNPKFASHCKSKRSSWSSNYSCYWQCTP